MRTLNLVNFSSVILSPGLQISQSPSPHSHPHGLPVKPEITGKQALREKLCLKKATNLVISPWKLDLEKYFCCNLGGSFVDYYENVKLFIKRLVLGHKYLGLYWITFWVYIFWENNYIRLSCLKNHPLTASCNKHYIVIWLYLSLLANYDRLQVIQG